MASRRLCSSEAARSRPPDWEEFEVAVPCAAPPPTTTGPKVKPIPRRSGGRRLGRSLAPLLQAGTHGVGVVAVPKRRLLDLLGERGALPPLGTLAALPVHAHNPPLLPRRQRERVRHVPQRVAVAAPLHR